MERSVTAPSAGVVYALANELSISLDYLFGMEYSTDHPGGEAQADSNEAQDDEAAFHSGIRQLEDAATQVPADPGRRNGPHGEGIVLRAKSRSAIDLSSGVRWERLTPGHDNSVDFLEVIYDPHGRSTDSPRLVRHDGHEYLLVLVGTIEVDVGFETYTLQAGDSVAFDSTTPHQYRNVTDEVVRCISIVVRDQR